MTTMIKMQARGVLTLPKKLRTRMNVKAGDIVELEEGKNGKVSISPISRFDKELMEDVRSALEDLRNGRVSPAFSSGREFALYMKSKRSKPRR